MPVLPGTRPSAPSGTDVAGQPHYEVFGSDMAVGGDANGDGVAAFVL